MKPIEMLDEILKYCNNIPERFTQENAWDWFSEFSEKLSFQCELKSGASKMVIVPSSETYVIKIPFTGYYLDEDGDYCDGSGNYEAIDYHEHEHANEGDYYWDYCGREVDIYEAALKEGLESYFASEMLLGFIEKYPVYVQQKALPHNDSKYIDNKVNNNIYRDKFYDCCAPYAWVAKFIELYGEDEMKRLNEFCEKWSLGDLSGGNIGYDEKEMYPILIDYSNYCECG